MRIGAMTAVLVGGALLVAACGKEAGTGELGPVDPVTSATAHAAQQITSILAGPAPSDTASASATEESPPATVGPPSSSAAPTPGVPIELPARDTRDVLTVWLLPDTPDSIVAAVDKRFAKAYPNVNVSVVRQDWATLSSQAQQKLPLRAETPDVIEMGNNETAGYLGEGLLADLGSVRTELHAGEWTEGLKPSTEVDGMLAAVPGYGYGHVVAYDKAAWKAAGVSDVPESLTEFSDALEKVQSGGVQPDYSAFWFPGRFWVGSLPWIWSEGGELAIKQDGEWIGAVDSGESQAGLTELRTLVRKFSKAPADADDTTASQVKAFNDGRASSALMAPWEVQALSKPAGLFVLPGKERGSVAPQLLEGSNLSVSAASPRQGLAVAWLQTFLDLDVQKKLAAQTGWIPGLAAAVDSLKGDPMAEAQATLAKGGRFTPSAPDWASVEEQQVLPDMLQTILVPEAPSESASASASGSPSVSPVPLSSEAGVGTPAAVPSGMPSMPESVPTGELLPSEPRATG